MNESKNALTRSPFRNLRDWLKAVKAWEPHQVVSFAQEGEDLILNRILGEERKSGFYVDVGAHHPRRFSNTYMFYRRGWRGINIDAMPGSMAPFRRIRPFDVNLETPVMKQAGRMTYYQFNEPALNGFSKELSESRDGKSGYKIIRKTEIEGAPLSHILETHLPAGTVVDFLSVDAEGLDLDVLQSNDWTRFRPKVVLVEILASSLANVQGHPIHVFLAGHGYQVFTKAMHTVFFLSSEYLGERERSEAGAR